MRYFLAVCGLFLLVGSYASAADRAIAPDWTLATPAGEKIQLSEKAKQKNTVLFFWATWCPYCKALLPHLQSMQLEYGDEVEILAISIFEDGDPAQLLRNEGYDFTLLLDGDDVAKTYGISGTPGVIVINHDREIYFDLRHLPPLAKKLKLEQASNQRKAAFMAPYWAAEIRKAIDTVRQDSR